MLFYGTEIFIFEIGLVYLFRAVFTVITRTLTLTIQVIPSRCCSYLGSRRATSVFSMLELVHCHFLHCFNEVKCSKRQRLQEHCLEIASNNILLQLGLGKRSIRFTD